MTQSVLSEMRAPVGSQYKAGSTSTSAGVTTCFDADNGYICGVVQMAFTESCLITNIKGASCLKKNKTNKQTTERVSDLLKLRNWTGTTRIPYN